MRTLKSILVLGLALILIAYLTGLSIGVHLLNLLCLPAIVLVYYYKKVPNANAKGSLLALLASMVLVAAVLYGIVPGIVKVGGWFELLFVNTLGLSFNSGVIVYIILLATCLIWGVYESYTEKSKSRMALSASAISQKVCRIVDAVRTHSGFAWRSRMLAVESFMY